jgi:Protein of unknown function (DUF2478)
MSLRDDSMAAASLSAPRIAAIRGASNRAIQDALGRFAQRWSNRGVRIAGLIETIDEVAEPARQAMRLQNIRSRRTYPLFQKLGPMASSCHLQGGGIAAACVDICAEIEAGCDLLILNKFGQLEALRSGLMDAFIAAVGEEIPILTAVSPVYAKAWEEFAASLSVVVSAEDDALDAWWNSIASYGRHDPRGFCDPKISSVM